jgi:hypothetical protein
MTDSNLDLDIVWSRFGSIDFPTWIQQVSDSYNSASKPLAWLAALLDVSPAELQAVLNLALIEESDLEIIGRSEAPRTTWMALADASTEAIQAACTRLISTHGQSSPYLTVLAAITEVDGSSPLDRISSLPQACFDLAAKRGLDYSLIDEKWSKVIKKWGRNVSQGRPLSIREAGAAFNFFITLRDGNALEPTKPEQKILVEKILALLPQ